MNVGARFSPLRTSLFVSDVVRRQRSADFALSSAVSIAFAAAPSMACDSITLPPQSMIAMARISLFFSPHAVHASASARAPALEMIVIWRVMAGGPEGPPLLALPEDCAVNRVPAE